MKLIRATYRPGLDRLVYVAVDPDAAGVVIRVYGPCHGPRYKIIKELNLYKLEDGVFAIDFDFEEIGNYTFVVAEDGEAKTVLNAKVYA